MERINKPEPKYTNPAKGILDFCKQKLWPLPSNQLIKELGFTYNHVIGEQFHREQIHVEQLSGDQRTNQ